MAAPRKSAYDVIVVGAGVIGLSCAWRLAQRDVSVLVAERHEPGAGASGVAAGMLAAVTEAEFGEDALLELNLASAALWPAFAAELEKASGQPSGYARSGALVVAADRDDAEELRRLHAFQRSLGLDVEWLAPRECRRLEPRLAPRIAGGILARHDNHVEPRALLRALTAALHRAGGELATATPVAAVESSGAVRTADGAVIAAEHVVVAAGPWSSELGGAGELVRPVKGQILRLAGPMESPLAARLVRTPRCYVVPRASGEVVVGATQEERGFDTRVTAGAIRYLLEAAEEVLPDVRELELVEVAARLRPGSPDNAPLIGRDGDVVWASAHHRNGILLAPITAAAVADLVTGQPPPPEVTHFSPARFSHALEGSPA